MHIVVESPLKAWETYCVIVGSAAAALTGLQFVVLTLVGQSQAVRGSSESLAAFGSPNVVHFCSALLVSAILTAPWSALRPVGASIATCGAAGLVYTAIVMRRARSQSGYAPVLEDWIWHVVLPGLAYGALLVGGLVLARRPEGSLFAVGGAMLLLVFIGIHNSWDTVTYVTVLELRHQEAKRRELTGASVTQAAPAPAPAPPSARSSDAAT